MTETKRAEKYLRRRSGNRLQRNDTILAYAFMIPTIVYMIVWVIFPILSAFVLSFTNYDIVKHKITELGNSGISFVGLKNYRLTLQNPIFKQAVGNTIYYALGSGYLYHSGRFDPGADCQFGAEKEFLPHCILYSLHYFRGLPGYYF